MWRWNVKQKFPLPHVNRNGNFASYNHILTDISEQKANFYVFFFFFWGGGGVFFLFSVANGQI
jgi:hypothetical protein